jgi:hypothetical protein
MIANLDEMRLRKPDARYHVILCVVGHGLHDEPGERPGLRAPEEHLDSVYCRDDIGNRWVDDSDRLHNGGYLREA